MPKPSDIGRRHENATAEKFRENYYYADRLVKRGLKHEPDVTASRPSGPAFLIQCKETARLNVNTELAGLIEALESVPNGDLAIPLVVWRRMEKTGKTGRRRQAGPETVTLRLEDFLEIAGRNGF